MTPFLSAISGRFHSKEIDREVCETIIFRGGPLGATEKDYAKVSDPHTCTHNSTKKNGSWQNLREEYVLVVTVCEDGPSPVVMAATLHSY